MRQAGGLVPIDRGLMVVWPGEGGVVMGQEVWRDSLCSDGEGLKLHDYNVGV